MNSLIEQFIELTRIDHEIAQVREQLSGYPMMIAQMDAVEARQAKLIEEAEAALEESRHERRKVEKEIAVLQEQIRKLLLQQSAVKTNKEYQTLLHEIEQVRGKIDALETAGIEYLDSEEKDGAGKKEAQGRLAAIKAEHGDERRRIEVQIAEKQARAVRLGSERERRLAALPEDQKEDYILLNERYPGTACAPLDGENCGGCHWTLVPHTRQLVRKSEDLVHCEHCRRYLYAGEPGR
jgi:predicted  nucleic acid-binding Zn-ribbon protein